MPSSQGFASAAGTSETLTSSRDEESSSSRSRSPPLLNGTSHNQSTEALRCQVIVCNATKTSVPGHSEEVEHLIRTNTLAGYWEANRRALRQPHPARSKVEAVSDISAHAQISPDTMIGEGTRIAEKAVIKKCVIGRHCNIGAGARLTGCVLWDFVTVDDE